MARKKSKFILSRWSYWRKQVERWQRSGLSQAEYCRKYNLAAQQLSQWKHKLKDGPATSDSSLQALARGFEQSGKSPDFIEVNLQSSTSSSYRIELTNGRILHLNRNFRPEAIAELLSIMEQPC